MRSLENNFQAKLFLIFSFVLVLATLETLSFLSWKFLLPPSIKVSVQSLCVPSSAEPIMNPNAFWHHELNPRHDVYRGQTNSEGYKSFDFKMPKPANELRVICVGDSTVEGHGLLVDETFPYYLQQLLKRIVSRSTNYKSVSVLNAGIGSHNSAFALCHLALRLIHYQPDVVVLKVGYNDYIPYILPGMRYDYTHAFPAPYMRYISRNPYWSLARHSYLLKAMGILLFNDEVNVPYQDFSGYVSKEKLEAMDYSSNEDKFYIYAENIRSMIVLCKARGIRIYLLDLPTSPNPKHYAGNNLFKSQKYRTLIKRFESEAARVAEEEGVSVIPTADVLESADFRDHCHTLISGNMKIARKIADFVFHIYPETESNRAK